MSQDLKLHSKIQAVPLGKMRVSQVAQRELRPARVNELAADLDLEMIGNIVVNFREGWYWIIDGQHRKEALIRFLGEGWERQQVDCRVYSGLSEQQEADMFDKLNNALSVGVFDKFKVRLAARRPVETAIRKIVEKQGLKISKSMKENSVSCVGTLVKIYNRADGDLLGRALHVVHESFGDPGMQSAVIDGFAHLCQRYNGVIDDADAIERLRTTRGGIGSVLSRAEMLRKQTGRLLPQCVAAAVVDTLNAKRGGNKLPSWWKTEATASE